MKEKKEEKKKLKKDKESLRVLPHWISSKEKNLLCFFFKRKNLSFVFSLWKTYSATLILGGRLAIFYSFFLPFFIFFCSFSTVFLFVSYPVFLPFFHFFKYLDLPFLQDPFTDFECLSIDSTPSAQIKRIWKVKNNPKNIWTKGEIWFPFLVHSGKQTV